MRDLVADQQDFPRLLCINIFTVVKSPTNKRHCGVEKSAGRTGYVP
jgi:hypothetical protein